MVKGFLYILDLISFDDILFRKEFRKTLQWISVREFETVKKWMIEHNYSERYPDLLLLVTQK
jgi:hypothetical protein